MPLDGEKLALVWVQVHSWGRFSTGGTAGRHCTSSHDTAGLIVNVKQRQQALHQFTPACVQIHIRVCCRRESTPASAAPALPGIRAGTRPGPVHGDPAADQIVRSPSGGCRGDLISTPDSGYNRVFYKSFLWGNLRFGGCFEKPSLQALFWCKKLRSRKKIGKVTKRRRLAKPTCANGGTNRANGGTNASFCTSGDFQLFLARGQVCFEFEVRR